MDDAHVGLCCKYIAHYAASSRERRVVAERLGVGHVGRTRFTGFVRFFVGGVLYLVGLDAGHHILFYFFRLLLGSPKVGEASLVGVAPLQRAHLCRGLE